MNKFQLTALVLFALFIITILISFLFTEFHGQHSTSSSSLYCPHSRILRTLVGFVGGCGEDEEICECAPVSIIVSNEEGLNINDYLTTPEYATREATFYSRISMNTSFCTCSSMCTYLSNCTKNNIALDYEREQGGEDFRFEIECESVCMTYGRPYKNGVRAEVEEVLVDDVIAADTWSDTSKLISSLSSVNMNSFKKWKSTALSEHASIATFSDLTLSLMSLSPPPSLLHQSLNAAIDELEHAKSAFTISNIFNPSEEKIVEPSNFEVQPGTNDMLTLKDLVVSTIKEGCFNEHISQLILSNRLLNYSRRREINNIITDFLIDVVREEGRHADLSYSIVEWVLRKDPSLKVIVEDAINSNEHVLTRGNSARLSEEEVISFEVGYDSFYVDENVELRLRRHYVFEVVKRLKGVLEREGVAS